MQRAETPLLAVPSEPGSDRVDRPHPFWWVLVLGGLTLLAFQAFDAAFYAWWTTSVHALPGQITMMAIFIACIPIHAGEAIYCHYLARRLGMPRSAMGWGIQTMALGFPSTYLLRKRARAVAARASRG